MTKVLDLSVNLKVKPLEWSKEYPERQGLVAYSIGAINPFGGMGWGYRIDYPSDRSVFHATASNGFDGKFNALEEAISACEAHYQMRASTSIKAALEIAPTPVTRPPDLYLDWSTMTAYDAEFLEDVGSLQPLWTSPPQAAAMGRK